ncbi:MAG: CPBP family intramembrane metalloprotease [Clostridia bacterium]|nr:CPBP family intramembrane metalloprotease [Clostridia bacterium]
MKDVKDVGEFRKTFQKRNFYTMKDSCSVFIWALLLPLLVGFIFCYVSMFIAIQSGQIAPDTENVIYVMFDKFLWFSIPFMLLTQIVFAGIYLLYHKVSRVSFKASNIHFKKTNWLTAILSCVAGIVCVLGFVWLIEGCFGRLFEVLGINSSGVGFNPTSWGSYIGCMVMLGVVPAICEELLFRGIIFQGLKEKYSKWTAILISALLFALVHQNIEQFIYPFILGVVFAVLLERTNNLIYPILMHMFNNFTTITMSFMANMGVINLDFSITWWFVLIAIAVAGVTFAILFVVDKFYLQKRKPVEVEKAGEVVQTPPLMVKKVPLSLILGIGLAVVLFVINLFS